MIARLGRLIYWTGCLAALAVLCFGLFLSYHEVRPDWCETYGDPCWRPDRIVPWGLMTLVATALVWAAGRGVRYVLSNE